MPDLGLLVTPAELSARGGAVRTVDVRWKLGQPEHGRRAYVEGHIPGAVFADLDRDLASAPGSRGRHPLPEPAAFADAMVRLGIGNDTPVVAYDDQGGAIAARLWFLLRYFGGGPCALLDGGIQAWVAAGLPLEKEAPSVARAAFTARPHPELLAPKEEMADAEKRGALLLLDARAPERFRGDTEPVDARPGHIPGAVNAPHAQNVGADGQFKSQAELRERFAKLGGGSRPTVAYCGSGVTACHDLFAMALAGLPVARLYPGSYSEWARDAQLPVATGA